MLTKSSYMLNKNTWGVKKVRGQEEPATKSSDIIKMHGLASHFVYVGTIVLVYVYMCIIIFVSAHNTLVF